jgi:hypothetical protein
MLELAIISGFGGLIDEDCSSFSSRRYCFSSRTGKKVARIRADAGW